MKPFKKIKAYLIRWNRGCYFSNEQFEIVVLAKDESYAVSKFLRFHNAELEKIEIVSIREISRI